jgi:hypothetical protein
LNVKKSEKIFILFTCLCQFKDDFAGFFFTSDFCGFHYSQNGITHQSTSKPAAIGIEVWLYEKSVL